MRSRFLFDLHVVAIDEMKREIVTQVARTRYVKEKQQPAICWFDKEVRMPLSSIFSIPKNCPHSGAQSTRVPESDLRSRGVLVLGSIDYDKKMDASLKMGSSRIKQGDEFVYCCHVVNQYPHSSSNQFVNKMNAPMHGVYIHAPNQTDVMKAAAVMGKSVQTFVAPAIGSGPIQPLQLGDVYAVVRIAGTKEPGAASRPKGVGVMAADSNELPAYESAPGYENPPVYEG